MRPEGQITRQLSDDALTRWDRWEIGFPVVETPQIPVWNEFHTPVVSITCQ